MINFPECPLNISLIDKIKTSATYDVKKKLKLSKNLCVPL